MRKLTLILAAAGCVGLAAPAASNEMPLAGQSGSHVISTDLSGKSAISELSAQKKKTKKSTANRSSWGG